MEIFGWSLCIIILILSIFWLVIKPRKTNFPPTPFALPILGHLHLLKPPPHRALQALSQKYGAVVHLRFGSRPVVVVSSPSAVEQCFTTNDIIFANRPKSLAGEHLGYNHSTLGFSPYGNHWRNLRRIATTHVFSSASVTRSAAARAEEIRFQAKKLASSYGGEFRKVNLNDLFLDLVNSTMMRMVAGKRWSGPADMFGPPTVMSLCDYVPVLRWVGFQGMEKKLVKMKKQRDDFLQGLIDERRKAIEMKKKKTIIEALLLLQEAEPESYTDEVMKGVIMVMFTAGTHSTSLTMEWAMAVLLNRPDILEKAQNEIEMQVGCSRLVEDSDLSRLPYLHCIINETLRLFPSGPLLVPHFSSQHCTISGYEVPKDTTLIVNAWAIHRDSKAWENATEFEPERWFRESREAAAGGFKFVPFGMGRRACPGSGLAIRLMSLVLGTLIQCFEWGRVRDGGLVDMEEEGSGLSLQRVQPLEAMYRPRQSMATFVSQL
ncbi:PREDICTED: cytochrome P450 81D11-like [Ipomoea nil]|uniref:cytochrome P450 81D11-like n=1 Tax=Ipomoea nil TaxID=35883 RepID=UPI000900C575|nr:PREDICTED: cytochrome P450 81D11-like [Ipomoea nil]